MYCFKYDYDITYSFDCVFSEVEKITTPKELKEDDMEEIKICIEQGYEISNVRILKVKLVNKRIELVH